MSNVIMFSSLSRHNTTVSDCARSIGVNKLVEKTLVEQIQALDRAIEKYSLLVFKRSLEGMSSAHAEIPQIDQHIAELRKGIKDGSITSEKVIRLFDMLIKHRQGLFIRLNQVSSSCFRQAHLAINRCREQSASLSIETLRNHLLEGMGYLRVSELYMRCAGVSDLSVYAMIDNEFRLAEQCTVELEARNLEISRERMMQNLPGVRSNFGFRLGAMPRALPGDAPKSRIPLRVIPHQDERAKAALKETDRLISSFKNETYRSREVGRTALLAVSTPVIARGRRVVLKPHMSREDASEAHIRRLEKQRNLETAKKYVPVFYVPQHNLLPKE